MVRQLVRNGDVMSGAVLAALGAYIFVQSRAYDYYTADGPGPGFFPTWYGVAMVVLSLALIVTCVAKCGEHEAGKPIDWPAIARAAGTWAAFAGSVLLMWPLGFLVGFPVLAFCVVVFVFNRSALTAAITAVLMTVAFHIVFPVLLEVELPIGWFGF